MNSLSCKHRHLQKILGDLSPLAVAFSGGVDSSLLLKVAHASLGNRCIAVTVDAPYHFRQELADAARFSLQLGVQHLIIPFDPATVPGLLTNPPDRCYLCKRALLELCLSSLSALPLDSCPLTLVDGSTLDDQTVHRPGRRALQERGIRSPLAEAEFSKQDIRNVSQELGLPGWNKPAQSCLLTRFPHNYPVTSPELQRVERSEIGIQRLGFSVVRVRSRGTTARIECEKVEQAQTMFPDIERICRQAGFARVELDPAGYRSGG
jgi:pyridinium-3,5-biscarboxylic acid mononucleotide sulfurtransferase